MTDLVRPLMSNEGRANLIADTATRADLAGDPRGRHKAVAAIALEHLRAAFEQGCRIGSQENVSAR